MNGSNPPLVKKEALEAFIDRLVATFSPERVILFGSLATNEARWDSDADLLIVMPFEGRPFDKAVEIRQSCQANFPIDLIIRTPQDVHQRYLWGDPFIREAVDHGIVLHG